MKSHGLELAWNSCLTGGDDIEGRPESPTIPLLGIVRGGWTYCQRRLQVFSRKSTATRGNDGDDLVQRNNQDLKICNSDRTK